MKILKFTICTFLISFSALCQACDSYVIGFKGMNGVFDVKAFDDYVGSRCSQLYAAHETKKAINFINKINLPYELYGFSLGAQSLKQVLKEVNSQPIFILTIGAYHTADVNFDSYNIEYKNYFDSSGQFQRSPGIHVKNVRHIDLQKYVNKEIKK